jgi:hypothetical protein
LEPGGAAAKKEAVNTHSNARFGREVEWNVSGNDCFCAVFKAGPRWRIFASYTRNTELSFQPVR